MQGTGIGSSLTLLAIGAVFVFAVNLESSILNFAAVGAILIVAGIMGLVLSVLALGHHHPSNRTYTPYEMPSYQGSPAARARPDPYNGRGGTPQPLA